MFFVAFPLAVASCLMPFSFLPFCLCVCLCAVFVVLNQIVVSLDHDGNADKVRHEQGHLQL
jgi:hypothetical protein